MFWLANEALEIRPEAYWRLTPAELAALMAGARAREERMWERTAWALSHELNVAGKTLRSAVTVDQLLGRRGPIEPLDPEAKFEALWSRMEKN